MYSKIYGGFIKCPHCGEEIYTVVINDSTVIREFSINYYIQKNQNRCHVGWQEDERYCVLVKWDDFIMNPQHYINQAFDKREHAIAKKVRVYPS